MPNNIRLAVTGHRPQKLDPERQMWARSAIRRVLTRARRKYGKLLHVNIGMALGADMWTAEVCVELNIPFTAYIPFSGQADRWPKYMQDRYRELVAAADSVIIVSTGGYEAWKMHRRNEVMLGDSDVLFAVWDGELGRGGTASAVRYWRKRHAKHIHVNTTERVIRWWRAA